MPGDPVTLEGLAAEVRALRARVNELEYRMRRAAQELFGPVQQQQQQQQQQQFPPAPRQQQQQQIEPGESWGLRPPVDQR